MRKTCPQGWSMQFFVRHFAENGSCGLKFQHPLSFLVPNMMRMLLKIQLAFFWHEIVIAPYEAADSAFRWLVWLGTENLVHQFLSYLTEGMHRASFWKFLWLKSPFIWPWTKQYARIACAWSPLSLKCVKMWTYLHPASHIQCQHQFFYQEYFQNFEENGRNFEFCAQRC